jgi:hypothetical protein
MKTILTLAAASVCILATSIVQASVVVVTPSDMNGWAFVTTDSSGNPVANGNIAQMVTGPATPPQGTGSAQLATPNGQGDGSAQLGNYTSFNGMTLSSLTTLSYSTYDTVNNGSQFPYLRIYLNNNDALYFEPPYQTPSTGNSSLPDQGTPQLNTWQTWNALGGGWWADNPSFAGAGGDNVKSLNAYLLLNPGVLIEGIRFAVGYASYGETFNGYVDNFTIGTAAGTTTYDFEPAPVPEPTTMVAGALLLLPFGASTLRLLRRKQTA